MLKQKTEFFIYIILFISVLASPAAPATAREEYSTPEDIAALRGSMEVLAEWRQFVPTGDGTGKFAISYRYVINGSLSCAGQDENEEPASGDLYSGNQASVELRNGEQKPWSRGQLPVSSTSSKDYVTVCEVRLSRPDSSANLKENKQKKSEFNDTFRNVVFVGDTGCREKDGQVCTETDEWPFPQIAESAITVFNEEVSPDMVIHLGDLRYRGKDDWNSWNKDFFEPAKSLLKAAPWIIVRGNHDNCYGDKGEGWLRLFGVDGGEEIRTCPRNPDQTPVNRRPYALDVFNELRLIVLDTANSYHRCYHWSRDFGTWDDSVLSHAATVKELVNNADGAVWLISHFPILNLLEDESQACGPQSLAYNLRDRLEPLLLDSDKLDAIFSGDIHQFQVLRYEPSEGHWVQFVVGNSGARRTEIFGLPVRNQNLMESGPAETKVEVYPDKKTQEFARNRCLKKGEIPGKPISFEREVPRGHQIVGFGDCRFGYLVASYSDGGWNAAALMLGKDGELSSPYNCKLGTKGNCSDIPLDDPVQLARKTPELYDHAPQSLISRSVYDEQDNEIGKIESLHRGYDVGSGFAVLTPKFSWENFIWVRRGDIRIVPLDRLRLTDGKLIMKVSATLSKFKFEQRLSEQLY